jgi:acyl-CoA thioester hydrolase
MEHEIRVIFGDTDQMGVVYYANYLRYFEGARAAYWRALGRSYKDLEAWGIALPVVEAHCEYRRPAYYEDVLVVEVWVSQLRSASLRFAYRIRRGDERIADGTTRHAVIGKDGKLIAIEQRLTRENAQMLVARQSTREDVRNLFGPPFRVDDYPRLARQVWLYPMHEGAVRYTLNVDFTADGRVYEVKLYDEVDPDN